MSYVKVVDGAVDQYPYTWSDVKGDYPFFSRQVESDVPTQALEDHGIYSVTVDSVPSFNDRTQTLQANDSPTLSNGSWSIGWTVSDKSSDEVAEYDAKIATSNRKIRNDKLAETDFYALSDVTMSAAMTTYRQALRDITAHANWPNLSSSDWPVKP